MLLISEIVIGTLFGFLIGLIPSVHINTIAYVFVLSGLFALFSGHFYFFLAIAVSQLISSFIPSTLFGVPNESNLMTIFPAQRFFLAGKAKQAILLCMTGLFFGVVFSILLSPLLYLLFNVVFAINWLIAAIIFFMLLLFVFSEKELKAKFLVFLILSLAGLLGVFTLKYNYFLKEPLIVCIPGLFAIPVLILSLFESPEVIRQSKDVSEVQTKKAILLPFFGTLASVFAILIPSFSSSQAALIISKIKKKLSSEEYLLIFSSIAISALIFSFFLAIYFSKARLGYIATLISTGLLPLHINIITAGISVLLASSIAIFLVIVFLDNIINTINRVSLRSINIIIILVSLVVIIILSGISAIPILLLSILIGFLPVLFGKSRVILMAYIMVPTLLFYI
jgi:putative membrane protein